MRTREHGEQGAVAVLVGITAPILFLIAALVVDLGFARDVRRQSQNAADSSALAAGNALYALGHTPQFQTAVDEAKAYAATNFGVTAAAWESCTDPGHLAYLVPGETECVSFDSLAQPTQVRVRIPDEALDTGFGRFAGTDQVTITSSARAALVPGYYLECGLCVLGSGATHDLQNGDATVAGGNIHFNGNVSVSNNGLVATTGSITVEGTASGNLSNYTPDPQTGADAISDPLESLALPPDMSSLSIKSNPCASGPGIYEGHNFSNVTCALAPGLYVITSGTWSLDGNSNAQLAGTGVTLYFTCETGDLPRACNSGEEGATLDATGNGSLALSAPTAGPLQGLAIIYDRNNEAILKLAGNGNASFSGTIYAANGTVQMNGNGCSTYNAAIVVHDLEMNGNPACLKSSYDANQNYQPPPSGLHLDQ